MEGAVLHPSPCAETLRKLVAAGGLAASNQDATLVPATDHLPGHGQEQGCGIRDALFEVCFNMCQS